MLAFLRNCQPLSQRSPTILHSHQQQEKVPALSCHPSPGSNGICLAIMAFNRYHVLMVPEFWKANSQILEMRESPKLLLRFIYLFVWVARNTYLCKKTEGKRLIQSKQRESREGNSYNNKYYNYQCK